MSPQAGQVINNKYRLLRHIGDGGMGSVYEARHEALGTTVALKFLHLEFAKREGLVQRFLREARASAQIQSPHVVRVADVEQSADGGVFIVLEYLEGKTLQALYEELYRAGRRLPYPDALDYAVQMLEGVEAAHQAGIVHRDLKPDNVMITVDPKGATVLKLLDFGIAKLKALGGAPGLTRPGVTMGTPEYMAPEQATSADTADARADVFSLGVIIFEMLAGRRPVGGDDPFELAEAYRSGRIAKLTDLEPSIAPELGAAVHRAMAARPEDRFPSAVALLDVIEPFAAAVRAPSPSRLRAGGTIGVSPSPVAASVAALPAPPPPAPDGGKPPATQREDSQAPAAGAGASTKNEGRTPPGRVAKTWPPDDEPPAGGSGTFAGEQGQTRPLDHAYPAQVLSMDAGVARTEPIPMLGALPPARAPAAGRRRRRGTPSVVWMLLVAAGIAGAVTGIAYLASRPSSTDNDPSPGPTSPPPQATVTPQPPQVDPGTPPPFVPPVPAAPPTSPRPSPSGTRPKPSPSATPSAAPSAAPPGVFVLPSVLPIPNPFQAPPQPSGGGSAKPQDPPLFPL